MRDGIPQQSIGNLRSEKQQRTADHRNKSQPKRILRHTLTTTTPPKQTNRRPSGKEKQRRRRHTPIQNLIALTWIPLTLIPPVSDANTLQWKTSPQNFVEQHFDEIMRQYYMNLTACQYDPQKVGKMPSSYSTARNAYKLALAGIGG